MFTFLKNELRLLFTALMFYTRIPVPKWTGFSSENLNKATRYLPLVGVVVGSIGGLVVYLCGLLHLPIAVAVIIAIVIMVLTTGAFHEDALSDFSDGFGGGYTVERILTIMKDSRIGVYGAAALVLLFLSKYALFTSFNFQTLPIVLITAHAASRVNPVLLIFSANYVADPDKSKSKPIGLKSSPINMWIAILIGWIPVVLLQPISIPFLFVLQLLVFWRFRAYVIKHIGGYTGDVLGALQQISEIVFVLTYLVVTLNWA